MSLTIAAMPAYNEERSIAKMVLGCKKYVDQVVVVDDGSSDATAEIAEALGAYVVRHEKNGGYGAALRSCFETARALGADRMVIIDSDGQHDASEIPQLLTPLSNGSDLVIGSRFCDGNGKNIPAYRKVGMKVLDVATNVAGGVSVTDSQSGFRAYGRKAIERIYIKGSDMSAGSEVLLQAKDLDLQIKEVEIHCSYDVERGSTQNPVSHGVKTLLKILHDMELQKAALLLHSSGDADGRGRGPDGPRVLADLRPRGDPAVWTGAAHGNADAGGVVHGADRDHIAQHIQNDE